MKALKFLLPLVLFAVLFAFLYRGLSLNPREVPSPLIGKPAPQFTLPRLHEPDKQLSAADLRGQVYLLNVWGSWCVSCRTEHPVLNELAKSKVVPIYGLNWKDPPEEAKRWLAQFGDPFIASVSDLDGKVAIDYGVYGAPETFLIDKHGIVRYKHIGPLTDEVVKQKILPKLRELQG
jgi:cytochrome c biogenesis protein CcmG/thiol:disulfide interchange protein DsbE